MGISAFYPAQGVDVCVLQSWDYFFGFFGQGFVGHVPHAGVAVQVGHRGDDGGTAEHRLLLLGAAV